MPKHSSSRLHLVDDTQKSLFPLYDMQRDKRPSVQRLKELVGWIQSARMAPEDKDYLTHAITRLFCDILSLGATAIEMQASRRSAGALARLAGELASRVSDGEDGLVAANEALSRRTQIDPLTGLLNQYAFPLFVREFLGRDVRSRWCALGVADMAKFKEVNDKFGHSVGDKVLTAIGSILGCTIRVNHNGVQEEDDVHARLGGDEFAFFLPHIPGPEATAPAFAIGERFRRAVIEHDWNDVDSRLSGFDFRIDVGIVCVRLGEVSSRRKNLHQEMFAEADKLMYQAKQNGPKTKVGVLSI